MCLQTELSTELYEAKNLAFNLLNRTLGNSNLKIGRMHKRPSTADDDDNDEHLSPNVPVVFTFMQNLLYMSIDHVHQCESQAIKNRNALVMYLWMYHVCV